MGTAVSLCPLPSRFSARWEAGCFEQASRSLRTQPISRSPQKENLYRRVLRQHVLEISELPLETQYMRG